MNIYDRFFPKSHERQKFYSQRLHAIPSFSKMVGEEQLKGHTCLLYGGVQVQLILTSVKQGKQAVFQTSSFLFCKGLEYTA